MEQMQAIIPNGEIHTPYGATEAAGELHRGD